MFVETVGWITFSIVFIIIIFTFSLTMLGLRANQVDWGSSLSNIIDGLLRLFCHRYHRLHHEPIPLPEKGGAIIACNHISGLDPLLIVAACRRPVHFMIAEDQYVRFGVNWLFRLAGCIPVDRNARRNDSAFRAALRALEEGKVIALFPQGGIHHGKEPPPRLKRGVHRLAQLSGVPIYPLHVSGVKGIGHIIRGVFLRGHARIESFDPVHCAEMSAQECLAILAERMKVTHH